jgi:DNA mismatch endonuclease (patch repair protein)
MPKSRFDYWPDKIKGNKERDEKTLRRLRAMRWKCLVLWECELRSIKGADVVQRKITRFLK